MSSHFRDCTKLDQKGRETWGRVARASLAGRSGGEGQDKYNTKNKPYHAAVVIDVCPE